MRGDRTDFLDSIKKRLNIDLVHELLRDYVPPCLKTVFKAALMLKFDEKPDYSFFISHLAKPFEIPK